MNIKHKNETYNLDNFIPEKYHKISNNHYQIDFRGTPKDCYVVSDDNYIYAFIEGSSFSFEKIKDIHDIDFSSNGTTSDRVEVKPPMPGSVVKLLVKIGQKVEEGEGLIIVEAMKMETTIYSSITGIISEINAETGSQVDANKILMVVSKE